MSEQQSMPTIAETGSVSAAPDANNDFMTEPVMAESPAIAPDQELTSPKADAPKIEKIEKVEPKVEAPKIEAPRIEAPRAEVQADKKTEAPPGGNVVIMSPGERMSAGEARTATPAAPKRRMSAMAAAVALAAAAGAIGGALATSGLGHGNEAAARNAGLEATVARIDADIVALKASVEQNARLGVGQFNRTSDRLDKVERAQLEPAMRIARLADEVSKLRAAQAAAAAPAAAPTLAAAVTTVPKDVTGSVAPPASAATQEPGATAKLEVGRLPTVEGWVLRDVDRGSALIENRRGLFEVNAGDSIPGVGRVDAIRKQDGHWVVVTSKGLIVSR